MKKISTVALIALIVFACSRKTVTTSETKIKTETGNAETKVKAEAEAPLADSKTNSTAPIKTDASTSSAEMIAAGKTVYTTRCGKCHGLKEVSAYTEQRWEPILKSMIPKARLNDDEAKQVTAYVMANAKK